MKKYFIAAFVLLITILQYALAVKPVEYKEKQKNQASTWLEEQNKAMQGKTDNEKYAEVYTGKYLYTPPDPSSQGSITGKIIRPSEPVQLILAIPPDNPTNVFKGTISGEKQNEFSFTGLPPSKYDLIIIFDSCVYEGLNLHRGETTLTAADKDSIQKAIDKAEKFYTRKVIHRVEGETGKMTGVARAFCTFVREKESFDNRYVSYSDWRRHFMLVTLNDVGPGWQIVANRDLGGRFVKPDKATIPVTYRKYLGNIRVTDKTVNMGEIDLSLTKK